MLAILHSGASLNEETLRSMREVAAELYVSKPWLRHLLTEVYVEMRDLSEIKTEQQDSDLFNMVLKDKIEEPEVLSLAFALSLSKQTSKTMRKQLSTVTSWTNWKNWSEALRKSDYVCPKIHSVWDRLIELHASSQPEFCETLFENVFSSEFLIKRERKYLCLMILKRLMEKGYINEKNVHRILTSKVADIIRTHISSKKSYLNAPVVKVMEQIKSSSPSLRLAVATRLLSLDDSGTRDSAILSQILAQVNNTHMKTYVSTLIKRQDEFSAQALYSVGLTTIERFQDDEAMFSTILNTLVTRVRCDEVVGLIAEACATQRFVKSIKTYFNKTFKKKKKNEIVTKIISTLKKCKNESLCKLLLVLGYQVALDEDDTNTQDLVSDLLEAEKNVENEEATAVCVDVCISLLMQSAKRMSSMRAVVQDYFKTLCPRITKSHLELLLSIVSSTSPLSLLQVQEVGSSDDDEEEEEEEEEEDEVEEEKDELTKQMDMEDAALATIIRLRQEKSNQKKNAKSLMRTARAFQLRVLALIERFIVYATSSSTASPLAFTLSSHLLAALRVASLASGQGGEVIALRDRLRSIYKKLVSAKHICKAQDLDVEEAQVQTKELCNLALTRHVKFLPDLDNLASSGLMFLFRVLAANKNCVMSAESITDAYAPILDDLIAKKKGKISKPKILQDVITRHPSAGSCLSNLLIEYCVSVEGDRVKPRTLFQRHLCVVLLTSLVKHSPNTFSLKSSCECFVKLCKTNPFQKKQHIKTLMSLGQVLIRTARSRNGKVTDEMIEIVKKIASSGVDGDFSSVMIRSANVMLEMFSRNVETEKKNKKKKRKREEEVVKKIEEEEEEESTPKKKKKKKKKKVSSGSSSTSKKKKRKRKEKE